MAGAFLIRYEGCDIHPFEFVAAVKISEFDKESKAGDLAAVFLDEVTRGPGRSAGGQQVVDDDDLFSFVQRVHVHFQGVFPVLKSVGNGCGLKGKFPLFSNGNEPGSDEIGHGGAHQESPGLNADHFCDPFVFEMSGQLVDGGFEGGRMS